MENTDLQILREFTPEQDWLLQPGDMLYLPPNVAHYGVAQEDCMTLSIGFRAPGYNELLTAWTDDQTLQLKDRLHYQDPDLQVAEHNGEITATALNKIRAIIRQQNIKDQDIDRWFGQYITEPPSGQLPYDAETSLSVKQFQSLLTQYGVLWRSEYSRFAFIRDNDIVWLYVDGQEFELDAKYMDLVARLCDQRRYLIDEIQQQMFDMETFELLTTLFNTGAVEFPDNA
jgi:50S ribosomal protein L16 3-hydroxylase